VRISITDDGRDLFRKLHGPRTAPPYIARRIEYVQAADGTWTELVFSGAIGAEHVRQCVSFGEVLEAIAVVVDPDGETVEV